MTVNITVFAENSRSEVIRISEDIKFTMQYVPGGAFFMGSEGTEKHRGLNEGPKHAVTVDPFYMATYEVTFAQVDACVDQYGCKHRSTDYGWGRDNNPIVDVSWIDAHEFIDWLSKITGEKYRLPSEAEWEYATRANSATIYWWGDELKQNFANCDGCGTKWDDKRTAPVGSFPANDFGLYDTAGNVWEWVEDCWHKDYTNAPTNGRAWLSENNGNCNIRMIRGGSWDYFHDRLRSAERFSFDSNFRYYNFVGFRLAKSIL